MRIRLSTLTEAERVARERNLGRDRKRGLRQRARDAGRPDPATVDRAIVEAVRSFYAATPECVRPIDPKALLRAAALQLMRRAQAAYDAGEDAVPYSREAVAEVLYARLAAPAKAAPRPKAA